MVAPVARPAVRPSGWWYLAAIAVGVAGLVLGGILVRDAFFAAQDAGFDASLTPAGEDQILTILEPGSYTIAYSGPIIIYSTPERDDLIERLAIEIRPADGGEPLPLGEYEGLNDLQQDDAQYVPLQTVRFDRAGDYTLMTNDAGLDPERSAIVVSESPFRKLREGLERAAVVAVVGLALSLLSMVILARVRGRSKRAAASQGQWSGPPGGPWPPSGGGPGALHGPQGYRPPGFGPPGWGPPR